MQKKPYKTKRIKKKAWTDKWEKLRFIYSGTELPKSLECINLRRNSKKRTWGKWPGFNQWYQGLRLNHPSAWVQDPTKTLKLTSIRPTGATSVVSP